MTKAFCGARRRLRPGVLRAGRRLLLGALVRGRRRPVRRHHRARVGMWQIGARAGAAVRRRHAPRGDAAAVGRRDERALRRPDRVAREVPHGRERGAAARPLGDPRRRVAAVRPALRADAQADGASVVASLWRSVLAGFGLRALVKLRTWGVLAIGAAGAPDCSRSRAPIWMARTRPATRCAPCTRRRAPAVRGAGRGCDAALRSAARLRPRPAR